MKQHDELWINKVINKISNNDHPHLINWIYKGCEETSSCSHISTSLHHENKYTLIKNETINESQSLPSNECQQQLKFDGENWIRDHNHIKWHPPDSTLFEL